MVTNHRLKTLQACLTTNTNEKTMMQIIDNKASQALQDEIRKNCALQLVPPDTHRQNLAERAIQTFKSHFIAILSGVDNNFPMQLWDQLAPQTILTLNLLHQSHVKSSISAYKHINGKFDYNAMPLGPMDCTIQVHVESQK
jgi:hypothetical protein